MFCLDLTGVSYSSDKLDESLADDEDDDDLRIVVRAVVYALRSFEVDDVSTSAFLVLAAFVLFSDSFLVVLM